MTGILAVNDTGDAATRRFRLPDGYEAVLVDPDSPLAMAPVAQIVAGCVAPLPAILDAFRTGGDLPYEDYGPDLAEGQAGTTRAQFRHLLAQEWITAIRDMLARLQDADRPARVADIGMGLGWSSIALARVLPAIRIEGFDLDTASGDDVERYMYGFSILHCLPAGMAEQPSVATGTVMRTETLRRYAEAAGFRSIEVLPVEHDFFRFYRLDA